MAVEEDSWRAEAVCRGTNPDLWYPEAGQHSLTARIACGECVVKPDCLQYALDTNEKHGIWGGVSERQRRRIRGMGITAVQYFEGVNDGSIRVPRAGRIPRR